MRECGWTFGIVVAVCCSSAVAQESGTGGDRTQQDLEQMRRDQQRLQELVEQQQRRLDELERQSHAVPAPSAEKSTIDVVHWNEIIAGSSKFKIYGFLRLDAIYDDSRPNNTQTIGFILSEDPDAPSSFGAGGKNRGDFTMDPRLTRFGIDFDGPVVSSLDDAKLTGKLEIDFYNNGLEGQSESRSAIRMRHAYLKMSWTDTSILAGQTNDVISPIFPAVNPDFNMWNAGNLGDRRPQLRGEYTPMIDDATLINQAEIGLTGADDNSDLDAPGTYGAGYRDGETSGYPTLQGRVAYRYPTAAKQPLETGIWADYAWENPDTEFAGKRRFRSYAVGMDYTIPLQENVVWLKGELWTGANVDDVRGGIFQGINTVTGEEIGSKGGWAELDVKAADHYVLAVGYSRDDPDNVDLNQGGRSANKIWYIANTFPFPPVEFGIHYLHWVTEYIGFGDGTDNRIQAYVSYAF